MSKLISFSSLLGIALLSTRSTFGQRLSNKVLLRDVSALTLRKGEFTTHRRVSPVRQLSCNRGCTHTNFPDEIQCTNAGFDGMDVNWKCEANLPIGSRLTHVNIQCEGYDYPEDPYILVGSCGASFDLEESKYQYLDDEYATAPNYRPYQSRMNIVYDENRHEWSWPSIIMALLVGYIFYNIFCGSASDTNDSSRSNSASRASYNTGNEGWGRNWSSPFTWWGGSGGGFFSGLGLGSLLGSMWSRPRSNGWGHGWSRGWGRSWNQPSMFQSSNNYSSNWFGNGRTSAVYGGSGTTSADRRTSSTSYATTTRR